MPEYQNQIIKNLELFKVFVATQERQDCSKTVFALVEVIVGAFLGFGFGWLLDLLKERGERNSIREAFYQEIANNYEANSY